MKHLLQISILSLVMVAAISCSDDLSMDRDKGMTEDRYRIELARSSTIVNTRAADAQEESIENVAVFVFSDDGSKNNGFVQHSSADIRYIDIYLTSSDHSVYVVCNHPFPEALVDEITTLDGLLSRPLTISSADGAHPGHYVMSGHTTVSAVMGGNGKVPVYRLASHMTFDVTVDTREEYGGDGGIFKLTNVYMCNIPRGSFLFDRQEGKEDVKEGCTLDYTFDAGSADAMRGNYFERFRLAPDETENSFSVSFDMFENRRGFIEDIPESWPELNGLQGHPNYHDYKQLYKRTRAKDYPGHIMLIPMKSDTPNEELDMLPEVKEGQFYNASYLRIDGVYQFADGITTLKTSYHIYLGEDNYKDFNVKRNYFYRHKITIRSYDLYDHRVSGEIIDGLTVYADLEELDAHCNVVKALMYSPDEWTVSVKNPDLTPWLEVSHSSIYKPRLAGKEPTGDEAAFSISGKAGLSYFYVHTDDYIPDIDQPYQNLHLKPRKGVIVCRSQNMIKEYEVEQLPAEIVILHIDYDVHTMKEVCDTFFIERKLEQKYMPWGFHHYWCYTTDDLIASGLWDGLSNTRKLYDIGLNGETSKLTNTVFPPAYPDGLPYDHPIGYVVSKNRDRNGNGRIDYNEILWYWPAQKELVQIYETKSDALLHFEGWEETFHSSTPGSSDKYGVTPGLSVRVKMSDGKWAHVQRDRRYNVIACRRKNAWKGPDNGNAGGGIILDPDWDEEDEVILPKWE